jgi:hypothetical protein
MNVRYYAITDHVGAREDLAGREVKIAFVRTLAAECRDVADTMHNTAAGRVWYRCFPTGNQVPTRGGIMRVRDSSECGIGSICADMLSADEMLVRVRADLESERDTLRLVTRERDHLRAEVERWRARARGDEPDEVSSTLALTGGLGW